MFAAGSSGNVAPIRVLRGPDTGIATPRGVTLDAAGRLYVTNFVTNSVTVYAPGASGDQPPIQTISGDATGLSGPWGIQIDHAGHIWVADYASAALTEYAGNAGGNVAPLATIGGTLPSLVGPQGLGQDSAGNLLVADFRFHAVLRFRNAPPYGNVNSTLAITPDGGNVTGPHAVDVDSAQRLLVADQQSVVNIYPPDAVFPSATISGASTDIKAPNALAVVPPFTVTSGALPPAAIGRRYVGQLFSMFGQPPIHWARVRGRLPRGLTLGRSGEISGTPRSLGRYRLVVSARDASHPTQSAERTVTLVVGRAPSIASVAPARGTTRGGTAVTIQGIGFSTRARGTTVAFGRIRSPRVRCPSRTQCIARTPPGTAGRVAVTVTVGGLTSSVRPRTHYTYAG